MTETIRRADTDVRVARAWLATAGEPGNSRALAEFVAQHGPVEAVERIMAGEAPVAVSTLAGTATAQHAAFYQRAGRALADTDRHGARFVVPEDDEWPTGLSDLTWAHHGVPLGLWVKGDGNLRELTEDAVAIVGSRASTAYGEHVAAELAHQLAKDDNLVPCTIVSGGAYGIDAAAHRGALAAGGSTIAVLACGVDRPYPAGHKQMFERIVETGGLLVSEYPPGAAPLRHRFLSRNRLLGALTQGLVVVEAAARSGAQAAAARATEIGRPVMAVPGPTTSAMSVGCHLMIRDGATLVSSADQVLHAIQEGI